jgi:CMP-2-keto-3-deoxyoctulosonic acid synthetase
MIMQRILVTKKNCNMQLEASIVIERSDGSMIFNIEGDNPFVVGKYIDTLYNKEWILIKHLGNF